MLNSKTVTTAATLLAVMTATAFSAPVMIDDFEASSVAQLIVDDGFAHSPIEETTDLVNTGGEVLGSWRKTALRWDEGLETVTLRVDYRDSGVLSLAEASDTRGNVELHYGYQDFLNADLTDGGQNSNLVLTFLTADLAGTVEVKLVTEVDSGESLWTGPTPSGLFNTPTKMIIPLFGAGWTDDPSSGAADRTDIDKLYITLHGVKNGDYVIDNIYTDVPEPASLLLAALGLPVLLKRRRAA